MTYNDIVACIGIALLYTLGVCFVSLLFTHITNKIYNYVWNRHSKR